MGHRHAADGAAGGDGDRRHLSDSVGTEGGDQASAARCPAASDPDRRQGTLLETERGNDGQGDGEHSTLAANLVAEVGATGTDPNVPAQEAASECSGARGGELFADLRARDLPGTAILDQGRTGLENQGLHLLGLTLEHLSDLRVIEVSDLREDEGGLLTLGKVVEVCEQLPELGTPLDFLGKARRGVSLHFPDWRFPVGA